MTSFTPERYVLALRKTPVVLNALLKGVTQEQAQRMTDGPDGWSVLETMCHIRDFADISLQRVHLILEQDRPTLPPLKPDEATRSRDYRSQRLADEFATWLDSRRTVLMLLTGLPADGWQRAGIHGELGTMTLLELSVHMVWHDLNHIEQIARSLGLSDAQV
ncbi:MAG TPA: DinB family protein [Aggregatilineales bacterium]|nr:DinB family protein [Aggregatilineales bacterium]